MDSTQPHPDPDEDGAAGPDLGLADLAPVDVPEDVFARALGVAVDPSTPPVGDDLLPDERDLPDDAGPSDPEDIDLSAFDDPPMADGGDGDDHDGDGGDDSLDPGLAPGIDPHEDFLIGEHAVDQGVHDEHFTDHEELGTVDHDNGGALDDDPSADL